MSDVEEQFEGQPQEEVVVEELQVVNLATPIPLDVQEAQREVKLFNKWSFEDVEVNDVSLVDYIQVRSPVFVPHTAGKYATKRFRKAQCPIIERLTNSLMMNGRNNGKKLKAVRIVKHALEIIYVLTEQNPIQVIVDAIINSGAREDSTRIGSSGTVRRQAVDVSPLRRVNQAIALLTIGAREASFRNIKTVAECLAEELINAAKGSSTSYAIKKRMSWRELLNLTVKEVTNFYLEAIYIQRIGVLLSLMKTIILLELGCISFVYFRPGLMYIVNYIIHKLR